MMVFMMILVIILIGLEITIEVISLKIAKLIIETGWFEVLLEIPKHGFKMDMLSYKKYKKNRKTLKYKNNLLSIILLLLPGINIRYSLYVKKQLIKEKEDIFKDFQEKHLLIPMSEQEQTKCAMMRNPYQQVGYALNEVFRSKEVEIPTDSLKMENSILVEKNLITLLYEKLTPLAYTLEEVKKLNEATKGSYRIGKMDEMNVAIIGIPDPTISVDVIQFPDQSIHHYQAMSLEEAKKQTFLVYPFLKPIEKDEYLCQCYQDILTARHNQKKSNHSVIPFLIQDSLKKETGPKLVKRKEYRP